MAQSISKCQGLIAHKRIQTEKTAATDFDRPNWLGADVAKINMELWDTDFGNENDTDFSYDLFNIGSDSDGSDPHIY